MPRLDGGSQPVTLSGNYRIRAPGVVGQVNITQGRAISGVTRSVGVAREGTALDRALAAQSMQDLATVDLSIEREIPQPSGGTLRGPTGDDAIELEVPAPKDGSGTIVLSVNEAGAITWNFPLTDSNEIAPPTRAGAAGTLKFRIPKSPAHTPTSGTAQTRSIFGVVGKKILKVLIYPATDRLVGPLANTFAGSWEKDHRPYRFRTVTPDNYNLGDITPLTPGDAEWKRLGAGRSLFFVHGTFSSTHSAFAGLERSDIEALSNAYGGRVFAFDHFTLSHSPAQNVNEMAKLLPTNIPIDADILCHSRGGLVAREMIERAAAHGLNGKLSIGKVVFVGVPNAGTILTSPSHMIDMIDRMTTAIDFLPDGPVAWILEGIITAVKVVGHGGLNSLAGLMSMIPNGDYLNTLGGATTDHATYLGIAADFDAKATAFDRLVLIQAAGNKIIDRIFQDAQNDLVVPTAGVAGGKGTLFPIPALEMLTLDKTAKVTHTTYFSNQAVRDQLHTWLVP
ncbi:MAG: alpha/beta hydrolase [Gemmatimonadaceae bacterium]